EPWYAGRLQIVRLVFGDCARHRRLDRLRRIEADVALTQPIGFGDRVHQVADSDDAGDRYLVEVDAHTASVASLSVREVVGNLLCNQSNRIFPRLARAKMIAGEDGEYDRPAGRFEDADVVAHIGQEIAGLVWNPIPADVSRDARAIQLVSHDVEHQIGRRLVD